MEASDTDRSDPNEGYIYGFILPFDVDNKDYCVVKIGMTTSGQLGTRLKKHNSDFRKATGIEIFTEPIRATLPDEAIVYSIKHNNMMKEVFLISYINNRLRVAEFGARACIGVTPFITTFKSVFPISESVTTTEWVVARKQVVENIRVTEQLQTFDSADTFLEKLKELNKRKHIELTISLETTATKNYCDKIKVPEYVEQSPDPS